MRKVRLKGAKYTRGKGPLELVYQKEIGARSEACKEELRIKKLSKKAKLLMLGDIKYVRFYRLRSFSIPSDIQKT